MKVKCRQRTTSDEGQIQTKVMYVKIKKRWRSKTDEG